MPSSIFVSHAHQPTMNEVFAALGERRTLWQALTQFIAASYAIPPEWNFGGKSWNLWYRRGGKTLVTFYPRENDLIAQVVLGKEQAAQALELKLDENVGTVLREARQLHDGRWLFVHVKTPRDVEDIEQLLLLKRRPKPKTVF